MSWFVKVIRSGARDVNGNLPPEVWSEGEVIPTLNQFDNTGESRATVIIFQAHMSGEVRVQNEVMHSLTAAMGTGGNNMPMAFYPIQGSQIGREDKNGPQGSGFGEEDSPMFTVNTTDKHAVAVYPIQDGRDMNHQQNGLGISEEGEPSYTLLQTQHASVAVPPSVVRRLTPTECERLQGFPDGWTEGQTDGHRYKQMGNAVAVPVVEWIMERLVEHDRV